MWLFVTTGESDDFSFPLAFQNVCKGSSLKKIAVTSQYLKMKHSGKHGDLLDLVITGRTPEKVNINSE